MPVPVLTEIHVIGHRIGMKHTLLAMTALTVGCGSRTTLDATSPADAAAAAPTSETCGFEVGGILHASVVGTPSACACGTEIPFILLKCTGKVADETYSLSVDYIPYGDAFEEAWLTVGTSTFTSQATVCDGTVLLDGGPGGDAGSYQEGEPITMSFSCPALVDDAGVVEITAGTIRTVISPK